MFAADDIERNAADAGFAGGIELGEVADGNGRHAGDYSGRYLRRRTTTLFRDAY